MAMNPVRQLAGWSAWQMAVAWALLVWLAAAVQAMELPLQGESQVLARSVELLEDPGGRLSLNEVREAAAAGQFSAWGRDDEINLGFSSSVWWVRLRLQRAESESSNWVLQLPYAYNRRVDFHAPGAAVVEAGSERPVTNRPLFYPTLAFPIRLESTPQDFYIRVSSSHPIGLPLKVWNPVAFFKNSLIYFFVQALYYGSSLALVAYNLFFAASLRDRRLLLYAAFQSLMALGILAGNGLGQLFLWPQWPAFEEISSTLFFSLALVLALLFSQQFMQTRRYAPALARAFDVMAGLFAVLAALQMLALAAPALLAPTLKTLTLAGVGLFFLLVTAGYRAIREGVYGIGYFIAAWSAFWIGGLVSALRWMDWVPTNTWTSYALQISTAVEMVLFATALAQIVKYEQKERIAAQNETLKAKQALLDMMQTQEEKLERTIQVRTQRLEEALQNEKRILGQYIRFGSLISHEFRNPLGTINSQATLLLKEQPLSAVSIKRANIIRKAVSRLTQLFDKWLEGDLIKALIDTDLSIVALDAETWMQDFLDRNPHFS